MIEKYLLVYNITSLPHVLYASVTPANEPLTFDSEKLFIPAELKGMPIELRVSLYTPDGDIEELSSVMLPAAAPTIATSANLTGLKLVNKLINKLTKANAT